MERHTLGKVLLSILIGVLVLFAAIGKVMADTTQRDIVRVKVYMINQGIYTVLMQDSVFLQDGVCDGVYYISHRSINTECGRNTSLDSFISVMLHELGHSEQKHNLNKSLTTYERYLKEADAWDRGMERAKKLGVWDRIDKSDYKIQRGIGLTSYRRIIKKPRNYIR